MKKYSLRPLQDLRRKIETVNFWFAEQLCADNEKTTPEALLPGLLLSGQKIDGCGNLCDENHRDSQGELNVPGLMPEGVHPE